MGLVNGGGEKWGVACLGVSTTISAHTNCLYKFLCVRCESGCDADTDTATDTSCRYELQIQLQIRLLLPDTDMFMQMDPIE